jgi:hypothetical protein
MFDRSFGVSYIVSFFRWAVAMEMYYNVPLFMQAVVMARRLLDWLLVGW